MDVGVVGAGRVGTAFAVLLAKAGHRIVGASGREASRGRVERFLPDVPFLDAPDVVASAEVVLLAVPDDRIAETCADLAAAEAFHPEQAVAHFSGSLTLEALAPAEETTALSLHPLQTFPSVEAALDRLPGSAVAITARSEEGQVLGERLAADVGGHPFRLPDQDKPLYHAAAVFCSNYITVLAAIGERLFGLAGVKDPVPTFSPLARAALDNALALGPGAALTGPAVRGEAGTIGRNLEALSERAPESIPAYVALARSALDLAERFGRLEAGRRAEVEEVLARWS